jgi:hypothetical protein
MIKKTLILFFGLAILTGCKITYSFVDQDFPTHWKTFSLENIEVSAPNAPASFSIQLTELIKEGLLDRTKLELLPSDDADVQITGSVVAYSVAPQAIQANETAAQNRLTIGMRISIITKTVEGEMKIQPAFNITRFAVYDAEQDLTSVEITLIEEINQQFVQDIINRLNTSS